MQKREAHCKSAYVSCMSTVFLLHVVESADQCQKEADFGVSDEAIFLQAGMHLQATTPARTRGTLAHRGVAEVDIPEEAPAGRKFSYGIVTGRSAQKNLVEHINHTSAARLGPLRDEKNDNRAQSLSLSAAGSKMFMLTSDALRQGLSKLVSSLSGGQAGHKDSVTEISDMLQIRLLSLCSACIMCLRLIRALFMRGQSEGPGWTRCAETGQQTSQKPVLTEAELNCIYEATL